MKYKEMQLICKNQKGNCKNCQLNCVDDWDIFEKAPNLKENPKATTWCFMKLKDRYVAKYQMHYERGELDKARETLYAYMEIEKKYLKKD